MKDLERNFLQAKEAYEKKANRARRIRTENTGGIFADEDSEIQYTNLEREFARRPSRKLRRVKKKKCSPSSRGAASVIYGQPPGMGGCNHESPNKDEDEEMEGKGDFRGIFSKDKDSKFRKIINKSSQKLNRIQ